MFAKQAMVVNAIRIFNFIFLTIFMTYFKFRSLRFKRPASTDFDEFSFRSFSLDFILFLSLFFWKLVYRCISHICTKIKKRDEIYLPQKRRGKKSSGGVYDAWEWHIRVYVCSELNDKLAVISTAVLVCSFKCIFSCMSRATQFYKL